jgi:hypothetical protein
VATRVAGADAALRGLRPQVTSSFRLRSRGVLPAAAPPRRGLTSSRGAAAARDKPRPLPTPTRPPSPPTPIRAPASSTRLRSLKWLPSRSASVRARRPRGRTRHRPAARARTCRSALQLALLGLAQGPTQAPLELAAQGREPSRLALAQPVDPAPLLALAQVRYRARPVHAILEAVNREAPLEPRSRSARLTVSSTGAAAMPTAVQHLDAMGLTLRLARRS